MANRYYTLLIVPEKTSRLRRVIIPSWLAKSLAAAVAVTILIGIVMVLDYWYVMGQIGENKQLKLENRRLKQEVQVFKNKMTTIENTMDRIRTFATRLKVITNIEDRGNLLQSLNGPLPDSSTNLGGTLQARSGAPAPTSSDAPTPPGLGTAPDAASTTTSNANSNTSASGTLQPVAPVPVSGKTGESHAEVLPPATGPMSPVAVATSEDPGSPEELMLRKEYENLDEKFGTLNRDSLYVEQMLQDEYELLADQKAFLAALPTRKPVVGFFTNGFGIRRSPFGGRIKMHEGLDIANHPGTSIRSPADGVVTFAASKPGYGQTLIIDHGYGLETWYGHTRKILVARGQKVRRGELIAQLGNSGRSTGPHCHYEVRVHGTPVDPLSYILEN